MNASPSLRHNRDFLALFGAQVISLVGSGVTTVGLALFAYRLTGGPGATRVIGTALMLRIVAFLLVSPFAGVAADRINRKAALVVADLVRFALLGAFPFVTTVFQVYALIFFINVFTAAFTPTYEATIPGVVGEAHYVRALSLSRVAADLETLLSPALAGVLVLLIGARWIFWFDSATYLASALLILLARIPAVARRTERLSARRLLDELTLGTRVLVRVPALRQALLLALAEATAGACALVGTVSYVQDVLGGSQRAAAWALAPVGLGSVLTALVLQRWTQHREHGAQGPEQLHRARHAWGARALGVAGLFLAGSLLPGILKPGIGVFAALWFLNGAGQALIAIPSSTLLAEHTAEDERGRAYAAHFALTHACWLLTYPAIGYAAAAWGTPAAFTVAGGACLAVTLLAFLLGAGSSTHDEGRFPGISARS